MLPGPTLAALLIWAQVALGQYTMTSRWGAAVAVLPSPPAIVIQGGKTDASAAYSYTSAPNTADTVLLSLTKPFDASSPPYTLLKSSIDGPAVAWHCLVPLSAKDGVWTLLSFGGDGGWAGQVNDKSSAWLVQINPQTGKTDYTPQPAGWGSQPSRRVRHSCAASPTGGKVYITGGQATDGSAIYDQVFVFDPSAQSFSPLPSLPVKLYHHSSVLLSNGTLVVFGGAFAKSDSNTDMQQLDKVFVLDTTSADATWSTFKTSGKKPSARRGSTAVLVSNDNIFVFGGADKGGGNVMNDAWVLSPASMAWTQVFDGGKGDKRRAPGDVEGRYDHVAAAAGGDQVVVVGGYGKNGPVSAEMVLVSAALASNGDVATTTAMTFTPSVVAAVAAAGGVGGAGAMAAGTDTNNIGGGNVPGDVASPTGPSSPNGTRPPSSRGGDGGKGGKTAKIDPFTGDTATPPQGTETGGALAAQTNNTAKIIGLSVGIIGSLLLLALLILVFLLLRRRRRHGHQFSEKQDGGQHLIGNEGEPGAAAGLQRKPTIGERLRGGAAGLARALSTKESGGRYERMHKNRGPTIFPVPRPKSSDSGNYGTALPTSPPGNIMYASTADLMMCPGYSRSASGATSMRSDASGEYSLQIAYDLANDDSVGRSTLTQGWLASDEASATGDSHLASNSALSLSRQLTPGWARHVAGSAALGASLARSASKNKSLPPSPAGGDTPVSGPDLSRPLPQLPVVTSPGGSATKPRLSPGLGARGSPSRTGMGRKASARSRRSSKASILNPFDDGDVGSGVGSASSSRRGSARASWRTNDESGDIGVMGGQRRAAAVADDDDPFTDAAGERRFSRSSGAHKAGLSGEFGAALSRSASMGMSSTASHRTFGIGDFGVELDLSLTDYTPSKPPSRPESPVHSACLDEAARATSPPLSPTLPTSPSPTPAAAPPTPDQLEPLLRDAAVSRLRPASWASAGSGSDSTAEPASIERAMRAVSPKRNKSRPVQLVISPTSPLKFTGGEWTTSPLASPTLVQAPTGATSLAEVASEPASAPAFFNDASNARRPPTTPAKTAPSTPGTTPRGTPRRQHRALKSMSSLGSIQAPPVGVGASVRDKVNYFEARAESGTAGAADGVSIQSSTPGRTVRKQTSFDPA